MVCEHFFINFQTPGCIKHSAALDTLWTSPSKESGCSYCISSYWSWVKRDKHIDSCHVLCVSLICAQHVWLFIWTYVIALTHTNWSVQRMIECEQWGNKDMTRTVNLSVFASLLHVKSSWPVCTADDWLAGTSGGALLNITTSAMTLLSCCTLLWGSCFYSGTRASKEFWKLYNYENTFLF